MRTWQKQVEEERSPEKGAQTKTARDERVQEKRINERRSVVMKWTVAICLALGLVLGAAGAEALTDR